MTEIPSPADIAEANRVKDEAADDALLEGWLAQVPPWLAEYRGQPIDIPLPHQTIYTAFNRTEVGPSDKLRSPMPFCRKVIECFAGTPWLVTVQSYPRVQPTYGRDYDHTPYPAAMRFVGREDFLRESGRERDRPETTPRRSSWSALWGRE